MTSPQRPEASPKNREAQKKAGEVAVGGLWGALLAWFKEFLQFGIVGAAAFVVDMGLFNLLQHGPVAVLAGHPNTANVASATTATIFSWIANRLWTYRGRTQDNAMREALLFAFANVGGVLITQFCLFFTHEVLNIHTALGDNIAAYVVGFALGTAFRFVFYHYIVFTGAPAKPHSPGAITGAVIGGVPLMGEDGSQSRVGKDSDQAEMDCAGEHRD